MTKQDDESLLSPLERRNSLEKALSRRPDQKDLQDRNILHKSTAAPAIQAQQHELEHAMIVDNLKKGLAQRPEKEELKERNILPKDDKTAPSLLAQKKELERSMLSDTIKDKLAHRPSPDDIIKEGILKPEEDPRSPVE